MDGDRFDIVDPTGKVVGMAEASTVSDMVSALWVLNLKAGSALVGGDHFVMRARTDQGVEVALQVGHSDEVNTITFLRNDQLLISLDASGELKIWDTAAGEVLETQRRRMMDVEAVAAAPDGKRFITGDATGNIAIWDVDTAQPQREILAHFKSGLGERIGRVAYASDGSFFISTAWDETVKVWTNTSGQPLATLQGAFETITGDDAALSPDGNFVATQAVRLIGSGRNAKYHCVVSIWNLHKKAIEHSLECGEGERAWTLAYSPDGHYLAIGTDHQIIVWDVSGGYAPHARFSTPFTWKRALAFSPNGDSLVAPGPDNGIVVVSLRANTMRKQPWPEKVTSVAFSKDGKILAVGASDGGISLVSAATFQVIRTLKPTSEEVDVVAMNADGTMAAAGSSSGEIRLWDMAGGQPAATLDGQKYSVNGLSEMVFSPDGGVLAVTADGAQGAAVLFDIRSQQAPTVIPNCRGSGGLDFRVAKLAYSPSGHFLAYSHGTNLAVWDVARKKTIGCVDIFDALTLDDVEKHIDPMNFAARLTLRYADDRTLQVVTSEGMIRSWTVQQSGLTSGAWRWVSPSTSIAISANGLTVAELSLESVQTVNLKTGVTHSYALMGPAVSDIVKFSHDGKYLAVADGTVVRVYDLQQARVVSALTHQTIVTSVCFSPDDRLILTGSGPGQLTLWQLLNNLPLANILTVNSSDWIAIDEDGFFDGSERAWSAVLFHSKSDPLHLFEPERFFTLFYQPGLISAVSRRRLPIREYLKSMGDSRSGVSLSKLLGSHIPELKFLEPQDRSQAPSGVVAVRLKVLDTGSGAGDCRVFRNRALIYSTRKVPPDSVLSFRAALASGTNDLSAYCFNRDGIKSQTLSLRVNNPNLPTTRPRAYIVSVGIDDYGNSNLDLSFAENDADDMASRLGAALRAKGRYDVVPVVLKGHSAKRSAILAAISRSSSAGPNDIVVVFFAGHGMSYRNHYFLVPSDVGAPLLGGGTQYDDSQLAAIASHSISDADLRAAFEGVDAGHTMLIVDACSSAALLAAANERIGPLDTHSFAQLAYDKGLFLIAAAQNYRAALEYYFAVRGRGNGLLTRALAWDGLSARARTAVGAVLTAPQWLDFAVARVPMMSAAIAKQRDAAQARSVGGAVIQRPRDFYPVERPDNEFVIESR